MRALTIGLSMLTPAFIYSQIQNIPLTVESVIGISLITLLSLSLLIATLMLGDK